MNALEQLILGWECLGSALRALTRPAAWAVWLPYALLRFGLLAGFAIGAHPLVSWAMAPLIRALAGEGALHYPELFRALPALDASTGAVLLATAGLWCSGAAAFQVHARASRAPLPAAACLGHAARRYPALLLATLPALALAWVLGDGVAMWLDARGSGPMTVRLISLAAAVVALCVAAWFAWLTPVVAAGRHGPRDAWHELGRLAARGYPAALLITLVTTLPSLPLWFVMRTVTRWIDRGKPEMVAVMLAGAIALTLLTRMIATLAITLAWRAIEEDPWLG